jgi:microcystin-dependent protein
MKSFINLIIIIIICLASQVYAQVKPRISFQGTLKDATGASVADGTYSVEFRLYDVDEGGTILWSETAQVESAGGVYSHYLGSVEDLDAEVFGQKLYLGVKIGASELQPRTELTYAPYTFSSYTTLLADTVRCSGAVGDVKYSRLNPTQFATVNGDCWMPMDGRNITGTKLSTILGQFTLPDASGMFIRAQEYGSVNNDADRTPGSDVATYQADAIGSHNHTGSTSSAGAHSHTLSLKYANANADGGGNAYTQRGSGSSSLNSSTNGAHSHTVTIANSGSTETRPKNLNLYIYIRVN